MTDDRCPSCEGALYEDSSCMNADCPRWKPPVYDDGPFGDPALVGENGHPEWEDGRVQGIAFAGAFWSFQDRNR